MRVLWGYTIFQGVVVFFPKKKLNLLLMGCFAKVGRGRAGTEATDNRKRKTSVVSLSCHPLSATKWFLLKPFPSVASPAFPSSLPSRIFQAGASGLHPKAPLPLHALLTESLLLASVRMRLGLVGSFLFSVIVIVLWPSHTLRSHIYSTWEHLTALPQSKEHQVPIITLHMSLAGAEEGV